MKKKFLFLMALLAVSLLALAEMTIFVYQKDGAKVEYLAANVDSIGFVNFHTIVFDANGGDGSVDALRVKESESVNLPANIFTKSAFAFTGWNTAADGSGTAYTDQSTVTPTTNMTLYAQWKSTTSGIADGHEWVDLGLPSGTKWATMNVGANSPEEYGDYFAWGETEPKETSYDWSTYKFYDSNYMTKYNTDDNKATLDISDDAAYVNWGISWCMPTKAELTELVNEDYTVCTWITQNGVNGWKVTSKINGNTIFLPAAGVRRDRILGNVGGYGYYWSSSLSMAAGSGAANSLTFYSDGGGTGTNYYRYFGLPVRPVLRKTYTITFDANGGEGSMDVISLREGDFVTLTANAFTQTNSTFAGWNTAADGSGTAYTDQSTITPTANMTLYAQWGAPTSGTENGHEWVDLGLPSGLLWATCNVGASVPEGYGSYYSWGETTTKSAYASSNYTYYADPTSLPLSKDAANVNWGGSWRMPTHTEQCELFLECTWTWTTQNGVNGYTVTSKTNGNSIFLPAAGYKINGYMEYCESEGYYWSSSLYVSNSCDSSGEYKLYFSVGGEYDHYSKRYQGKSIRPVMAK